MRSNSDILCEFQSKLNHNTYSTDQTAHHPKPLDERMFINIIYNEEGWGTPSLAVCFTNDTCSNILVATSAGFVKYDEMRAEQWLG